MDVYESEAWIRMYDATDGTLLSDYTIPIRVVASSRLEADDIATRRMEVDVFNPPLEGIRRVVKMSLPERVEIGVRC